MIFFIGIKGTGMAALACMLHDLGYEVAGSDLSKHFFTEEPLVERNIAIYDFNANNIKDDMTVIIGNAFLDDFEEVVAAHQNKTVKTYRYHEYLGKLMREYTSFSVAGSHGKTTTTGMLSSVMNQHIPTGYLVGDGTGFLTKECQNLIVESCEFRRHFLKYYPEYAIITNIEIDHIDYFKDKEDYRMAYQEFVENVGKLVVLFGDDPECRKLNIKKEHYYYGLKEDNDFQAVNLVETEVDMSFDVVFHKEHIGHYKVPFVGTHLLWNALGVIALAHLVGLSCKQIEEGLHAFKGVKRRYVMEKHQDNVFVDDYAHHPTEVKVTILATKKRFPNKKIIAIFKPHRASRVYHFAKEFKEALELADEVYLCDFTSIDDKQDGIDIDISYLQNLIKNSKILSEDEEGAKILAQYHNVVYLFMSSKDIYHLAHLVKRYQLS